MKREVRRGRFIIGDGEFNLARMIIKLIKEVEEKYPNDLVTMRAARLGISERTFYHFKKDFKEHFKN